MRKRVDLRRASTCTHINAFARIYTRVHAYISTRTCRVLMHLTRARDDMQRYTGVILY